VSQNVLHGDTLHASLARMKFVTVHYDAVLYWLKVLRWRTGAATAWSLILTVPLSLSFMLAVTFSLFDPHTSFYCEFKSRLACIVFISTSHCKGCLGGLLNCVDTKNYVV